MGHADSKERNVSRPQRPVASRGQLTLCLPHRVPHPGGPPSGAPVGSPILGTDCDERSRHRKRAPAPTHVQNCVPFPAPFFTMMSLLPFSPTSPVSPGCPGIPGGPWTPGGPGWHSTIPSEMDWHELRDWSQHPKRRFAALFLSRYGDSELL